jgi:general secretion pathway protein C
MNGKFIVPLNVLLGIILVMSILFLVRDVISNHFEKKSSLKKDAGASFGVAALQRKMQFLEYAPLMKNNPFGISSGEIKLLTSSTSANAQTMSIILIGTVSGPKELSYAVFKDAAGIQEVFRVGENIYGLGRLYSVKQDRALIRQGEKITEIPIEDIVKVKEVKAQAPATTGASSSAFAQRIGRGSYIVDQASLQQMIANPGRMMTDARLRPNTADGRQEGFMLSEVKPNGIYQSLGLQDGDVLLKINEYDISNPERALQAFTALKGLDRVQIDLIRSGARMTMTYQIK